jgi:hypothetical protein
VKYVDVFRFQSVDGKHALGDSAYPTVPILSRIEYYQINGDRYAYEELMLLSILCITRFPPIPVIRQVMRVYLDRSLATLPILLSDGKEPMICSELIYRCYNEADTSGKYRIRISGAQGKGLESDILSALLTSGTPIVDSVISEELAKNEDKKMKLYIEMYTKAKRRSESGNAWTTSDFITPHDLIQSPNLRKIGRLEIPKAMK